MKKVIANGRVTPEGKLLLNDSEMFKNDISVFAGKEVDLTVQKHQVLKTLNQNSFLHGPVIEIVQRGFLEAGYKEAKDPDWVRNVLKWKFLKYEIINEDTGEIMTDENGNVMFAVRSIADLKKAEYSEFIDKIVTWSFETLGVDIVSEYTEFKKILNQILNKYQL